MYNLKALGTFYLKESKNFEVIELQINRVRLFLEFFPGVFRILKKKELLNYNIVNRN